jgi:hypothetical protein
MLVKPINSSKSLQNRKEVSHNDFHKLQMQIFWPYEVVSAGDWDTNGAFRELLTPRLPRTVGYFVKRNQVG